MPVSNSAIENKTMTENKKNSKWTLGILRDRLTDDVPGSVLLFPQESTQNVPRIPEESPSASGSELSTGQKSLSTPGQTRDKTTPDGQIILDPQPHDSPNDPLNWSIRRRDAILISIGFYCTIGGGTTTILAAGFPDIAKTYEIPISEVALTTGLYMFGLGLGAIITAPSAIVLGKRPIYLFSAMLYCSTAIWCALSSSYASLLVARVVQGVAVSAVECLPSTTITEIFFRHELAYRLGIYTFLLLGGKNLIPLVSASVIQNCGWRWVFWIVSIIVGFCFILIALFVPETFWDRTIKPSKPTSSDTRASDFQSIGISSDSTFIGSAHKDVWSKDSTRSQAISDSPQPTKNKRTAYTDYYQSRQQKTFSEMLKPFNGRLSGGSWFRIALRPFVLFTFPSILWSASQYALGVGWLIVISESVSVIFRAPEYYGFSATDAGFIYVSPFIGGLLGTIVAGKVSDYIVRFLSRKNNGIYEPEFRLVMMIPTAFATTIGLIGYGWSAWIHDTFWIPTIFFGVISFGCTLASTTAINFAVDSYRQFAGEALVTLSISKNILHGLVFSLFFNSWLEDDGAEQVFIVLGCVQVFFLLWTIPMYIFGKRLRMWTVRRTFMQNTLN